MNAAIPTQNTDRARGVVKSWNEKFRHGLIANRAGGPDVFVNWIETPYRPGHGKNLKAGDVVEFYIVPGSKPGSLRAERVSFPSAELARGDARPTN